MLFWAWIAGGLIALCGALTYAEIGSRYPVTGGYYKIFSYCYHPSIAFAINCIILVSNAASRPGWRLVGAEYIANVLFDKRDDLTIKLTISSIAVVVFYGVNLLGLKMSARTQNVLNGNKNRCSVVFDQCIVHRRLCHPVDAATGNRAEPDDNIESLWRLPGSGKLYIWRLPTKR